MWCVTLYMGVSVPDNLRHAWLATTKTHSFSPIWRIVCSRQLAHGSQMAIVRFLDRMCLALRAWRTMAAIWCAAKFDPFLSLDCAGLEGVGKGSNFAVWPHWCVEWRPHSLWWRNEEERWREGCKRRKNVGLVGKPACSLCNLKARQN